MKRRNNDDPATNRNGLQEPPPYSTSVGAAWVETCRYKVVPHHAAFGAIFYVGKGKAASRHGRLPQEKVRVIGYSSTKLREQCWMALVCCILTDHSPNFPSFLAVFLLLLPHLLAYIIVMVKSYRPGLLKK